MTVYRSIDEARIDPAVLNRDSGIPACLRSWFTEAHHLYDNEHQSHAFKAGYYYGIIQIIEAYFKAQAQD